VKLAELSNNSFELKNVIFYKGMGQNILWLLHIFSWSRPPNLQFLRSCISLYIDIQTSCNRTRWNAVALVTAVQFDYRSAAIQLHFDCSTAWQRDTGRRSWVWGLARRLCLVVDCIIYSSLFIV